MRRKRSLWPLMARVLQRREKLGSLTSEEAVSNLQPWQPHVDVSPVERPLGAVRLPE